MHKYARRYTMKKYKVILTESEMRKLKYLVNEKVNDDVDVNVSDNSNARQRTDEISKQIVALTEKLQQQGYKNQDFIFERDERGSQTGWYVSEVDRTKYHKEYSEYEKSLYDKYEGKPNYEQSREIKDLLDEWVLTHTEYDEKLGMRIPSRKLYQIGRASCRERV